MVDRFPPEKRSQIMASIKGRNTLPERVVRGCLRRLHCRFRGHLKDLPGKPDMVLTGKHQVVFVHGCFWHGHKRCRRSKRPTANAVFWNKKIDGNIQRDRKVRHALVRLGWKTLVIWECETRKPAQVLAILERFMNAK